MIALNTSLNKKFGMKSDLWLVYFGNSYTIRGWPLPDPNLYFSKNEQFRFGHESVLLSIEYRQELIPKRSTSFGTCLLYTSPSPRDQRGSRMPSSA